MHVTHNRLWRAVLPLGCAIAAVAVVAAVHQATQGAPVPDTFAGRVAALSEPGGYFDTDNLISNERSYLHVAPELRALSAQASVNGVYLGVGPDQNFSYIAQLRPAMAIIVDIRRDNVLRLLLFKALFAQAKTRVEYLALLTGRDPPAGDGWARQSIETIVRAIDQATPIASGQVAAMQARLLAVIDGFGVPLSKSEHQTITGFHRRFMASGLSLQFNSTGRAPQFDYPTYRDLLLEVDRLRKYQSFLASEADFRFVKSLQARNLIIPAVGDLSGSTALAAVGRFLAGANLQVSAFYTSNVEFYLFRDGSFPRFIANLSRLPHQPGSLIVRSVFPGGRTGTQTSPGYNSASITQPIQALLDGYARGQFRQYWELVR
jgi:hypothetical protein